MAAPEAPALYQGVARTSAAFRLLKKMGWEEGEGLGKEKQGITVHVKVKQNKDNCGVGVDAQQAAAANWSFNTTVFDNILKNLKVQVADNAEKDSNQEDSIKQDSKNNATQEKKVARPQGRYKKRENGKLVSNYSQIDIQAILGKTSTKETTVPAAVDHKSAEKMSKVEAEDVKVVESCRISMHTSSNPAPVSVALDPEWWGSKHGFIPGGLLGETRKVVRVVSLEEAKASQNPTEKAAAVSRNAFCEQDQENLYNLVQGKATKGRQGLGIGDRPKKIGGAHWKGNKVTFGIDDDDNTDDVIPDPEENVEEVNEAKENAQDEEDQIVRCKRRKIEKNNDGSSDLLDKNRLNWKKICKQILQEAPTRTMSIKRLQKHVLEAAGMSQNTDEDNEGRALYDKEKLLRKLQKSSKFAINGRKVSLVSVEA